jgi:radical SAM protein (TIGR01212 family)
VDPATVAGLSVREQLCRQIAKFQAKQRQPHKFMAYLQAGSNTHAPLERLRDLYEQAVSHPDVVSLAVATRPDCLPEATLDLLASLGRNLVIWVELGAQTSLDDTLRRINRNHTFAQVVDATERARRRGFLVCWHLILGLPGETIDDAVAAADRVNELRVDAVKLHPLCITRGSVLERQWRQTPFPLLSEGEYVEWAAAVLGRLSPHVVVQRLGGSARREVHLAPEWTGNVNRLKRLIAARMGPKTT